MSKRLGVWNSLHGSSCGIACINGSSMKYSLHGSSRLAKCEVELPCMLAFLYTRQACQALTSHAGYSTHQACRILSPYAGYSTHQACWILSPCAGYSTHQACWILSPYAGYSTHQTCWILSSHPSTHSGEVCVAWELSVKYSPSSCLLTYTSN